MSSVEKQTPWCTHSGFLCQRSYLVLWRGFCNGRTHMDWWLLSVEFISKSRTLFANNFFIKMPYCRRHRPKIQTSCGPINTVDAQGTAYLCFPEDHSWFQGNISTEDLSNISLYGERVETIGDSTKTTNFIKPQVQNYDKTNNNAKKPEKYVEHSSEQYYYQVNMIDHFTGLKHTLPKIFPKSEPNCDSSSGLWFSSKQGEVSFQIDKVYKGDKAKMMIQKYIGSPGSFGEKCYFYSGRIKILFDETNETAKACWNL